MESIVLTLVSEAPSLGLLLWVIYMNSQRTTQILENNQKNLADMRNLLDKALETQRRLVDKNQTDIHEIKQLTISIARRVKELDTPSE